MAVETLFFRPVDADNLPIAGIAADTAVEILQESTLKGFDFSDSSFKDVPDLVTRFATLTEDPNRSGLYYHAQNTTGWPLGKYLVLASFSGLCPPAAGTIRVKGGAVL
jgi:hypothetical protein